MWVSTQRPFFKFLSFLFTTIKKWPGAVQNLNENTLPFFSVDIKGIIFFKTMMYQIQFLK